MLLKHIRSRAVYLQAYEPEYRSRLARPFETVETYLSNRSFLVGEALSLADISAATVLRKAYSFLLGRAERARYPHTFHFYETVINQPAIKDIFAGGQLIETSPQYVPPAQVPKEENPKVEDEDVSRVPDEPQEEESS